MEQVIDILYPSAAIENNDLEQRLEKEINDVNCCNKRIYTIK